MFFFADNPNTNSYKGPKKNPAQNANTNSSEGIPVIDTWFGNA
jgi:hypothetical protein